jgi:hypothetical protein
MDPYRYVLKQRQKDGSLWTSEVHEGDIRNVRQTVIAGYLMGEPRWAETSADSFNPYFFLFGIDRLGRERPNGHADFSE